MHIVVLDEHLEHTRSGEIRLRLLSLSAATATTTTTIGRSSVTMTPRSRTIVHERDHELIQPRVLIQSLLGSHLSIQRVDGYHFI